MNHSLVASDIVFEDMSLYNLSGTPFTISQCTTFSGTAGNCSSSEFQIGNITFASISGTTSSTSDVASFQCSAVEPCANLAIENVLVVDASSGDTADQYLCDNVQNSIGWNCTGSACSGGSATGEC